ncbi:flagellar hook-associated protein FlgL [Pengzhenrongella sicca]|uniref:Flagellar hook-associated protein FlgL n=1 Tax=Pengzhenrongella sicca TaxID=2819238 RepID=A0A8A4ZFR8_9MICO|nr:flagellar hook-associated protein FlgL [Pengzhenrongella sicca]QTE29849.1 flagellar hook-associated protein FlgL [Pengzhenrongella sicca]
MIGRVTQQTIQRNTLANLQTNLNQMSVLQNRLSGKTMITKPSDDPAGTASAIALRATLRANEQAAKNIDDGTGWLTTANDALSDSLNTLRAARDLTVQGGNTGSLTPEAREALAVQIESLRDTLVAAANTTYQGRTVFAGTSDTGSAVTVTSVAGVTTYVGSPSAGTVDRRVDANTKIRVDVDGGAAFGDGAGSVFATLDTIAAKLRAGTSVSGDLDVLDDHRDAMITQLSGVGARQVQIDDAKTRALDTKTTLTSQLSSIEDVDLAAAVVELEMQEVAYKAALGATARVMQPTLLDYLS